MTLHINNINHPNNYTNFQRLLQTIAFNVCDTAINEIYRVNNDTMHDDVIGAAGGCKVQGTLST